MSPLRVRCRSKYLENFLRTGNARLECHQTNVGKFRISYFYIFGFRPGYNTQSEVWLILSVFFSSRIDSFSVKRRWKVKKKSTKSIIFDYDLKIPFTRLKRSLKTEKMTLNLPVTYARIRLILSVGEYFVQPILFTGAELLKA